MTRRVAGLLVTLSLGFFVAPLTGETPSLIEMHRIGILWHGSGPAASSLFDLFRQSLRDLGYIEGQHFTYEHRYGQWSHERLRTLAAELDRLHVDVIFAPGTPPAVAAQRATTSIPIVFTALADPVEIGLVASLAQPAGNLTGLTILAPDHEEDYRLGRKGRGMRRADQLRPRGYHRLSQGPAGRKAS